MGFLIMAEQYGIPTDKFYGYNSNGKQSDHK